MKINTFAWICCILPLKLLIAVDNEIDKRHSEPAVTIITQPWS